MSSESTPMLGRTVPTFERLLEDWKQLATRALHCAPLINIGLTWAEKYDNRMACTNAYAVAMCQSLAFSPRLIPDDWFIVVDPSCRMSWVTDHWDEDRLKSAKEFILNLVRLFNLQWDALICPADACQASTKDP
jgi:hypothetical protein